MTTQDNVEATDTKMRAFHSAFCKKHLHHRLEIRKLSLAQNRALVEHYEAMFGIIVSLQLRMQGQSYDAKKDQLEVRMALVAQFVQGIEITVTAILEGLYPQAANLMKQELETIVALNECSNGTRKNGRVPQLRGMPKEWGKAYGNLNDLAHPSKHDLISGFAAYETPGSFGPTSVPQYREYPCRKMLHMHLVFLIHFLLHERNAFYDAVGLDLSDPEKAELLRVLDFNLSIERDVE